VTRVLTGKEEAARLAERDAGDAADDVVVRVHGQLLVGAQVEQAAGGVVGAGGEGQAVGEEGDGVDVRLVAGEGLAAQAVAHVPQLGRRVARAAHERARVGRQRQRHHVARVPRERRALLARLDVPQRAAHILIAAVWYKISTHIKLLFEINTIRPSSQENLLEICKKYASFPENLIQSKGFDYL